jgi:signal transduction histidine kinase
MDNGAGIPFEMLAKVFDKTASDPFKAGTGLGLAIVKQIVEAHAELSAWKVFTVRAPRLVFLFPRKRQFGLRKTRLLQKRGCRAER